MPVIQDFKLGGLGFRVLRPRHLDLGCCEDPAVSVLCCIMM